MIDFENFAERCPWATLNDLGSRCCSATRDACGVPGLCYQEECGLVYAFLKMSLNKEIKDKPVTESMPIRTSRLLSVRAKNQLINAKYSDIHELKNVSFIELLHHKGLGRITANEVREYMKKIGLSLKEEKY